MQGAGQIANATAAIAAQPFTHRSRDRIAESRRGPGRCGRTSKSAHHTTAVSPDLGNSAINPYALSGLDSGLWAISLREVKVLVKTLLDRGGGDYPPVVGVTRHRVLHRARGLSFTTLATTGPDVAPTFRFGITPTRYSTLPPPAAPEQCCQQSAIRGDSSWSCTSSG